MTTADTNRNDTRPRRALHGAASALALSAMLAALWLGEHPGGFPVSGKEITAALVAPPMLIVLLWRGGRAKAIAAAAGALLLFGVVWFAGRAEANRAFNECVEQGESVRVALANHKARRGVYPATLGELDMRLPGRLLLPPHLLRYAPTPAGYRLEFSDFLVSHAATESEPFAAHK